MTNAERARAHAWRLKMLEYARSFTPGSPGISSRAPCGMSTSGRGPALERQGGTVAPSGCPGLRYPLPLLPSPFSLIPYPLSFFLLRLVHPEVGEAVRFAVLLPSNVLERDAPELHEEKARTCCQRLKAGVFNPVFAAHLLDQQFRVGADPQIPLVVVGGPLECREQPVVFGDVVRGDPEGPMEFVEHSAVGRFNPDAIPCRAGISAGPAIDVRDDHCGCGVAPEGAGTK